MLFKKISNKPEQALLFAVASETEMRPLPGSSGTSGRVYTNSDVWALP